LPQGISFLNEEGVITYTDRGISKGISFIFGRKDKDYITYSGAFEEKVFNDWIAKVNNPLLKTSPTISNEMTDFGRDLIKLIAKIFLYISIPKYKVIPITKNQLHREGKPCVNNRPARPIYRVIYVPHEINLNKQNITEHGDGIKAPHFRRGHFRMLRNERFKKQGELIFVRPCMIHGGSLKDNIYVARKKDE
jgi:hypothetical protein